MPQKKSRRTGSKQASGSKQRKRKKRAQAPPQRAPVAPPAPAPADVVTEEPETRPVAGASQQVPVPTHGSISSDLRKIGIIAGSVFVVLIVLAFVL